MTFVLLTLLACFPEISKYEEERFPENPNHDYDGDTISDAEDCDDANKDIGRPLTYYMDADGDGFPNEAESEVACPSEKTDGYILPRELNGVAVFDCDDSDAVLTPEDYDQDGASSCDGDCNDRNESILDPINFYLDADGDGFGIETISELVCPADKSDGYIEAKERNGQKIFDCDDSNFNMNRLHFFK